MKYFWVILGSLCTWASVASILPTFAVDHPNLSEISDQISKLNDAYPGVYASIFGYTQDLLTYRSVNGVSKSFLLVGVRDNPNEHINKFKNIRSQFEISPSFSTDDTESRIAHLYRTFDEPEEILEYTKDSIPIIMVTSTSSFSTYFSSMVYGGAAVAIGMAMATKLSSMAEQHNRTSAALLIGGILMFSWGSLDVFLTSLTDIEVGDTSPVFPGSHLVTMSNAKATTRNIISLLKKSSQHDAMVILVKGNEYRKVRSLLKNDPMFKKSVA